MSGNTENKESLQKLNLICNFYFFYNKYQFLGTQLEGLHILGC